MSVFLSVCLFIYLFIFALFVFAHCLVILQFKSVFVINEAFQSFMNSLLLLFSAKPIRVTTGVIGKESVIRSFSLFVYCWI